MNAVTVNAKVEPSLVKRTKARKITNVIERVFYFINLAREDFMADQKNDQLYAMRHSLAHIMATAVTTLWPLMACKLDLWLKTVFITILILLMLIYRLKILSRLRRRCERLLIEKQEFIRSEKNIDEALNWSKKARQPYKTELLNDLRRSGTTVAKDLDEEELGTISDGSSVVENVSFYTNGEFTDCVVVRTLKTLAMLVLLS